MTTAAMKQTVYHYALKGDISGLRWPAAWPGENKNFAEEELTLAKRILAILVAQATLRQPLFYSDLSAKLGWTPEASAIAAQGKGGDTLLTDPAAPRFLGYPLNLIGLALEGPRTTQGTIVLPPLEVLVVEKSALPACQVPGLGFYRFWKGPVDWGQMGIEAKREATTQLQEQVYACTLWDEAEKILSNQNFPA